MIDEKIINQVINLSKIMQEKLEEEIKSQYPNFYENILKNTYINFIDLMGKDRYCTEKDDDFSIDKKKIILNNSIELLEKNINENFNNKINIFPKTNKYSNQMKKILDNFKEKINISKEFDDEDKNYNYEVKIINLLKKLNRNHILKYENKEFYPFIYDIFTTYNYICFEISKATIIINKINELNNYGKFEITDRKIEDIIKIKSIFSINQLKFLLYILFSENINSIKEYKLLMQLLLYKNDEQKDPFNDKKINGFLKKLDDITENTITVYKHFFYCP